MAKQDPKKDPWDAADEKAAASTSSDTFVKLDDDGDSVKGAFIGAPFPQELYWPRNGKPEPYTEEHEREGKRMTLRVRVALVIFEENEKPLKTPKAKVWEVNATTFRIINKRKKRYGLDKCLFICERSGKKGDQNTTYAIDPSDEIDDEMRKIIAGVEIPDMEKVGQKSEDSDSEFDSYDKKGSKKGGDTEDEPISKEQAQDLVGKLKTIPRDQLDEFLTKFGIAKVKMLKRSDLAEANKWIAAATSDDDEDDGGNGSGDPFS